MFKDNDKQPYFVRNTNLGVNLYAVREQDPGVKLQVITIVFSPSQIGFSAIIRACVDIS